MGAGGSTSFIGIENANHFLCRGCRRTFVISERPEGGIVRCPHCTGTEIETLLLSFNGSSGDHGGSHREAVASGGPFRSAFFSSGNRSLGLGGPVGGSGGFVVPAAASAPAPAVLRALPGGGFARVGGGGGSGGNGGGGLLEEGPTPGELFAVRANQRLATAATLFRLLEEHLRQELSMLQALEESENQPPPARPAGAKFVDELLAARTAHGQAGTSSAECTVCLEPFPPREEVLTLPCGHAYHPGCLLPWLREHCSCPECRQEVREQAAETRAELGRLDAAELRRRCAAAGLAPPPPNAPKADLVDLLQGHVDQERIRHRDEERDDGGGNEGTSQEDNQQPSPLHIIASPSDATPSQAQQRREAMQQQEQEGS